MATVPRGRARIVRVRVVPRLRPDDIGVVVVRVIDPDGRRRIAVVL
jgi:hypothetical protein